MYKGPSVDVRGEGCLLRFDGLVAHVAQLGHHVVADSLAHEFDIGGGLVRGINGLED